MFKRGRMCCNISLCLNKQRISNELYKLLLLSKYFILLLFSLKYYQAALLLHNVFFKAFEKGKEKAYLKKLLNA